MNDPYAEGRAAYFAGKPKTTNPYGTFEPNAVIWRAGWRDAQDHCKAA